MVRRICGRGALLAGALVLVAGVARSDDWAFATWRDDVGPAEEFLADATVTGSARVPIGISRPLRLNLEKGGVRADAIFKAIDEFEQKQRFDDGTFELNFRDSYKSEVAAYLLDRLLGLELVPPTVARTIDGEQGALRLWVVGAMSEAERKEKNIQAPDPVAWSRQAANLRLFFSLTNNSDYNNINNVLIDRDFRLCAIDHSRAFRTQKNLIGETMLIRFSRDLLGRLEALDEPTLTQTLAPWVSKAQIKALLKRRDKILRRADKMVELKGEELVLFD